VETFLGALQLPEHGRGSVKVVFIGQDRRIADLVARSCRLGWPEVTPLTATMMVEGLRLVEQEAPDVVILHPGFSDLSLSEAITKLRRFS
jgi:hypothetical protein